MKKSLTKNHLIRVPAYHIPFSDHMILGRTYDRDFVVATSDGVMIYTLNELEEIHENVDFSKTDFSKIS